MPVLRSFRGKPWNEKSGEFRETFKMVILSEAQLQFLKLEMGTCRDYLARE
jgi:hypothetical protein